MASGGVPSPLWLRQTLGQAGDELLAWGQLMMGTSFLFFVNSGGNLYYSELFSGPGEVGSRAAGQKLIMPSLSYSTASLGL